MSHKPDKELHDAPSEQTQAEHDDSLGGLSEPTQRSFSRREAAPPPKTNEDNDHFDEFRTQISGALKHIQGSKQEIVHVPPPPADADPSHHRLDYCEFLDRHYKYIGTGTRMAPYKLGEVFALLDDARESFSKQRTLVDAAAPIHIVGDIHGQFNDLINIFVTLGRPPHSRYMFLGDYVDRGAMSLQCICLLLAYKVLYPTHVYLLRGNHECARINKAYGFYDECRRVYGKAGRRVWLVFQKVFDEIPVYGLVENRILGMHGGLSPQMTDVNQLRNIPKPIRNPTQGLINDALWADPEYTIKGWQPSGRGTSFSFGEDIVTNICQRLGLDLIVCMDGYWFFAGKRMVTVFSAPNYCGAMPNAGAVMHVGADMLCTFHLFGPWNDMDANHRRIIMQQQMNHGGGGQQGGMMPVSCDSV